MLRFLIQLLANWQLLLVWVLILDPAYFTLSFSQSKKSKRRSFMYISLINHITHITHNTITHSSCHLLSDAYCSQRQQSLHDFHVQQYLQFYNYKRLIFKLKAVSTLSYTFFCQFLWTYYESVLVCVGRDSKKLAAVHSLVRQKHVTENVL